MKFIDNNSTILFDVITDQLSDVKEIKIAVAFIRESGLNLLINHLEGLITREVNIKILFGNEFGITDIEAIHSLIEIGAICKYYSGANTFHPKTYIFIRENETNIIIGSSNISYSAFKEGVEWNILLTSNEFESIKIINEFDRLWDSENSQIIDQNNIDILGEISKIEIENLPTKEDQIQSSEPIENTDEILDSKKNYIVKRRPDLKSSWNFQIYKNKIQKYSRLENFNLVVICDFEISNQITFIIPSKFLLSNILPFCHVDSKGRYLFEVTKRNLRFNWHYRIGMGGNNFILK